MVVITVLCKIEKERDRDTDNGCITWDQTLFIFEKKTCRNPNAHKKKRITLNLLLWTR